MHGSVTCNEIACISGETGVHSLTVVVSGYDPTHVDGGLSARLRLAIFMPCLTLQPFTNNSWMACNTGPIGGATEEEKHCSQDMVQCSCIVDKLLLIDRVGVASHAWFIADGAGIYLQLISPSNMVHLCRTPGAGVKPTHAVIQYIAIAF